jgi:L-iditol 2-dehydrogenase
LTEKRELSLQSKKIFHKEGDAVFETLFTTICGSDLRIMLHGDSRITGPRVLGHEAVARVISSGIRDDFVESDIVAIGADIPCADCKYCHLQQENLCTEHLALGYQIDGCLSSMIHIPSKFLLSAPIVKVFPKVFVEAYALAEPAGCVIHGIEYSLVQKNHKVLILGGGPIGIMIAKVCLDLIGIDSQNIHIVEPFEYRRFFIAKMGLNVHSDLSELTRLGNPLFDRIFTATSNPNSHSDVLDFIDRGGRINFFGGVPKNSSILKVDPNRIHYAEISLEGSHGSCPRHHRKATELISKDEFFWASMITLKTTLAELNPSISRMREGKELKVAVSFGND